MPSEVASISVAELVRAEALLVEDGNHGEYRPLAHEFSGTGTPFIRPDDLVDGVVRFERCDRINEVATKRVRKGKGKAGDILFTHRATVGRIARVGPSAPDFVANPGVTVWRVRDSRRICRDYLYYYMQCPDFLDQVWSMAGGTDTFPYISLTQQRTLQLRLPPMAEQEVVGSTLAAFDDRIELLRQTNATLESIAQAVFKSWFIDFDPVRAKADGREPEGMDAATAALFPAEFEESALGLIPKGWRAGKFGDMAELAKGSVNPLAAPDKDFEHYSLPAFDAGRLPILERGETIKSNKTRVPAGAVLQSKLNPHIPRVWLPSRIGEQAVCSTEFLPWVARRPASSELIYCTLTSPSFEASVRTLVTGTSNSHQRVKPDQVAALELVVAPGTIAEAFAQAVAPLLSKVGENRLLARGLAELRDSLLPRLISGKLRLPEAQAQLEEAIA